MPVDNMRTVFGIAPGIPCNLIPVEVREILFRRSRLLELEERVLLIVSVNVDSLHLKSSTPRWWPLLLKEVTLFWLAACLNLENRLINWLRRFDIEQFINGYLSHGYSIQFLFSF